MRTRGPVRRACNVRTTLDVGSPEMHQNYNISGLDPNTPSNSLTEMMPLDGMEMEKKGRKVGEGRNRAKKRGK